MLHISPDAAKSVPALVANSNAWRVDRPKARTVIVFVHGVLSNSLACWYNRNSAKYWPDMVVEDPVFATCSVFLGGYYTAFDSTDFNLYQCARQLLSSLHESDAHPAVMEHDRLIFVCHSLGGIVARYLLTGWQTDFSSKQVGLLLMASPSIGSRYANILGNPLDLLRHEIGRQLVWGADVLDDLDERFSETMQTRILKLTGMEACEHRFLFYRKWLGPLNRLFPRIVEPESAGRYFRPARLIPNTDHSSIVKPDSFRHASHLLLREFYKERVDVQLPLPPAVMVATTPGGAPTTAEVTAPAATPTTNQDPLFRCSRIDWNIAISEDGDAENDIAFERIVCAKNGEQSAFQLTPTWVQSGHTSRFEIDWDRSRADANLHGEVKPRLIQQTAVFDIPPTRDLPQTLVLRSIDFNVFSMDSAEFQRKKTDAQNEPDYVQKKIRWEVVEELKITVSFPSTMRLRAQDSVSAQGYLVSQNQDGTILQRYDEDLTLKAKAGFTFDSGKRLATLSVQKPAPWTAYRIWWRLAPPLDTPKAALLAIADINRNTLLSFRSLFDGTASPSLSDNAKKEAVLKALALFGAQAVAEVNRSLAAVKGGINAAIDINRLDLSLMAVQKVSVPAEHEVLRVVAGSNVPAAYWAMNLAMGDGIAGRAAKIAGRDKRIQFRKFRRGPAESMLNDAYLPFDDQGPAHQWLLSIPLHESCCDPIPYGVVNLGAFDDHNADLLEALTPESIEVLEKYVNGDFLRSVLNAVG
jgi:hypothetical protein